MHCGLWCSVLTNDKTNQPCSVFHFFHSHLHFWHFTLHFKKAELPSSSCILHRGRCQPLNSNQTSHTLSYKAFVALAGDWRELCEALQFGNVSIDAETPEILQTLSPRYEGSLSSPRDRTKSTIMYCLCVYKKQNKRVIRTVPENARCLEEADNMHYSTFSCHLRVYPWNTSLSINLLASRKGKKVNHI